MPTLNEILEDKKNFPDDRKITLADGVETTIGELRGGYMKDSDYRQKTSKLARERDEFSAERARFEQDKQEAEARLAELVEKAVSPQASISQQQAEWQAYLERDPLARHLTKELTEVKAKLTDYETKTQQYEQRLQQQQQALLVDQHRRVLAAIKAKDPDVDEGQLVDYARSNAIPRLDLAYRLLTEEKRFKSEIDKVKETTQKEAYEKAKRDLSQPALPSRRVAPSVPETAPKSFDEAADMALRDPEILATMEGQFRP